MDQGSGQRHESDGGGVRQEGAQGEAQERGALPRVPECGGQRQVAAACSILTLIASQ